MSEQPARQKIGKYKLVRPIGQGAMGIVYLAHDPHLDRHVAIKVIRKDVLDRQQADQVMARFRNEAMAAGRLQHTGIVAVYDYGEDEDTSFIVMEYAPGDDLEEYLKKYGPIPFSEVLSLMTQLLDALQTAHSFGVIHRDIKPSNLVVTGGKLKVTDFGIARISSTKLTQTGLAIGTPMYMAPEQYMGSGTDHRSDLFSAAVLFYELLTGHKPFEGDSIHAVAYKVCHVDPPPPSQLNPSLPKALDGVILRGLAKDKEARFASAYEFSQNVSAASGGTQPGILAPSAVRWPAETMRALEGALAPYVGPLATALVKRSAGKAADRTELVDLLRKGAGDAADNPALLAQLRAALDAGGVPQPVAPAASEKTVTRLSPEDLDRVAQALAPYVGPIARVLVKKTSGVSSDLRDLCARLLEHIGTPKERVDFLKKLGVS